MSNTTPSLRNLSGKYALNKSLSNDIAPILAIQGTSLLVRKAIASASVTLNISQPPTTEGAPTEYTIQQSATSASIPGTTEQYILDNEWRTNHDAFFGDVRGRSRWVSDEEVKREVPDLAEYGVWVGEPDGDGKRILAEGGKADGFWSAVRVWGFEEIEGSKRFVQRVKVWDKSGEEVKVKMVYDKV